MNKNYEQQRTKIINHNQLECRVKFIIKKKVAAFGCHLAFNEILVQTTEAGTNCFSCNISLDNVDHFWFQNLSLVRCVAKEIERPK